MKRLLPCLMLTLTLAVPTLAQPEGDRPGGPDREQQREHLQQRRDQIREGDRRGEPGPPPREGDRGPEHRPIAPEELQSALDILAEFRPEAAEELRKLAEEDPVKAAERVMRAFPRIQDFIRMKAEDPKRFDLHLQSMRIMRTSWPLYKEYNEARRANNEAAMAEIRAKLREQVAAMFEVRMELRRMEIEDLRAQIAAIEEELKQTELRKEEMIDAKLNEDLNPDRDRWRRGEREGDRSREEKPGDRRE